MTTDKPKPTEDARDDADRALEIAKRPDPHHEYENAPAAKAAAKKEK